MSNEALVKKSTFAVKKESSYGVDPTIADANIIRVADVDLTDDYDKADYDENNNSFDQPAGLRGMEKAGGSVTINLRGAGTAGQAPEGDVLFECAIGEKSTSTADTTKAGSDANTLVVNTPGNFAVDQAVRVNTATPQVVWITAIDGDNLSVTPAMDPVPGSGVAVGAGVHYKMKNTNASSFFAAFFRGDITREGHAGNKIDSMEVDIQVGQVIKPKFNFKGNAVTAVASSTSDYGLTNPTTATYWAENPLVGISQTITIGGSSVKCDKFGLKLDNEIVDETAVTSSGIDNRHQVGRKVSGSYSTIYRSLDILNAFKNDTTAEAIVIMSRSSMAAGKIHAFRIPKLRYTATPVKSDSKIYKYDTQWESQLTDGEDTLFWSVL